MGSSNVMRHEDNYCIWSWSSLGGFPLKEASKQERIHSIIGSIVWCVHTLRVWYNKVVVFYIVPYILCGDCIQISSDLLWYFLFRYLVLNKWYQSTFLGQTLWANIFYFYRFFFGEEKKGSRHFRKFQYIFVNNLQKRVVYMISSQKNTQVKKRIRLKRSSEGQDIKVLKSAIFQGFFCGRRRDLFSYL